MTESQGLWQYQQDGQTLGPITFNELLDLAYQGTISAETLIKSQQANGWQRARILPVEWPGEALSEAEYLLHQHNWYLRSQGEVTGPLTLEELGNKSLERTFKPHDELRYGINGEWQAHELLEDLLKHIRKPGTITLSRTSQAPESLPTTSVSIEHPDSAQLRSSTGRFFEHFGIWLTAQIDRLISSLKWVWHKTWRPLAIVTLLLATYILANMKPPPSDYELLEALQSQSKAIRDTLAKTKSEDEWIAFARRQRKILLPIVSGLESRATANNPAEQHLLWISRDCLLPVLNSDKSPENLLKTFPDKRLKLHFDNTAMFVKRALRKQLPKMYIK